MTEDATPKGSETDAKATTSEDKGADTQAQSDDKPNDIAAMERSLKKANKEAEQARKKLQEIEDAGKSETQKLQDAKAAAETDAQKARTELMRLRVGTKKGLAPELAERLQGSNEEEMAEDADRLLSVVKPGAARGDADQGARGNGKPKDMNDFMFNR